MMTPVDTPLDLDAAPEPPWQRYPGQRPWWGGWRQGSAEPWYVYVFLPFWTELSPKHQAQYLARWPPPDEDWAENLAANAAAGPREVDFKSSPVPPWQRYPGRAPRWLGWRIGPARNWLRNDFLPFWLLLRSSDQVAYLELWRPPDQAWRERMDRWKREI